MAVFFNGRLLVTPTIESQVIDGGMQNFNSPVGNVLCLIGSSEGGHPKKPIYLSSPGQARDVLKSGELLDAVNMAFAPSVETNAPQTIIAYRVNPATQATGALNGSSGAVINLTSTDYGLYTNQIKVKIEDGSVKGKRITTKLNNQYYINDNTARDAFTIVYSGANTTATIAVTGTTVTLVDSATTVIDLTVYKTVKQLVDAINANSAYTATCASGSENTPSLQGLDFVTTQSVKTLYTVTANLQAIVDWINNKDFLVDAVRADNVGVMPVNTLGWLSLTGGTDGTTTNQSWQDCFTDLQAQDVQWIVPLSPSAAVWAMTDAHCQYMSSAGKAERRAFVGGASGLSADAVKLNAFALNSDRTAYCYPGIYNYNDNGDLTLYPAYMAAALLGGAFAGINPGETMTNKTLRVAGLEKDNATPADTDYLINAGVLALYKAKQGGYRISKAISTWLVDQRYNRVEVSTGAAVDYVSRSVREALQIFVGKRASPTTIAEVVSATDTVLAKLGRPEPSGLGILIGDPAYKNIVARIDGDVLTVDFECSPVVPMNYILISVHANVWKGTATTAQG